MKRRVCYGSTPRTRAFFLPSFAADSALRFRLLQSLFMLYSKCSIADNGCALNGQFSATRAVNCATLAKQVSPPIADKLRLS